MLLVRPRLGEVIVIGNVNDGQEPTARTNRLRPVCHGDVPAFGPKL